MKMTPDVHGTPGAAGRLSASPSTVRNYRQPKIVLSCISRIDDGAYAEHADVIGE